MVKAAEAVVAVAAAAASLALQMVTMFSLLINSNIQVSVANPSFLKMIKIAKKTLHFWKFFVRNSNRKKNVGIIGNTDPGDKMKRRLDDIKEASENVVAGVPDEKILRPLLVSYLAPAPGDRWKRSSVSENDILNPTDELGNFRKRITEFWYYFFLKVVQNNLSYFHDTQT